jgi:hypothetical protein
MIPLKSDAKASFPTFRTISLSECYSGIAYVTTVLSSSLCQSFTSKCGLGVSMILSSINLGCSMVWILRSLIMVFGWFRDWFRGWLRVDLWWFECWLSAYLLWF